MSRALFAWVAIHLAVVGTGCTMCQHPYDYSGPVVDGPCPEPCHVRAGSILSGTQPAIVYSQNNVPPTATPPAAQKQPEQQTPQPTPRSVIVDEKPAQVEGRKTDQRLPDGWKGDLSPIPPSLSPLNQRSP